MFANNTIPLKYKVIGWYSGCIVISYGLYVSFGINAFIATFQAINTVSLFLLALYLFKKHGVTNIQAGIAQEKDATQLLHNQTDTLNSQKHILENTIATQRLTFQELLHKVRMWRETWNNTHEQRNHELQERLAALQEKRKRQSYQATIESTRRTVLAQAIKDARSRLIDQFKSDQVGSPFLANILDYIEEQS